MTLGWDGGRKGPERDIFRKSSRRRSTKEMTSAEVSRRKIGLSQGFKTTEGAKVKP